MKILLTQGKGEIEFHVFSVVPEDTICAKDYTECSPKEYLTEILLEIGNCGVALMRYTSVPHIQLGAGVIALILKDQIVKKHQTKIQSCSFWTE